MEFSNADYPTSIEIFSFGVSHPRSSFVFHSNVARPSIFILAINHKLKRVSN
jgi:hypothetical protein